MGQNYNIKNIRALLKQGFTPEELLELSYDEPAFRPVYEQFSTSPGKGQIVQGLIEYAERQSLLDHLLDCAKERNQACYDQYQPYTASSTNLPLPSAVTQAVAALDSPLQTERLNAIESLAALVAKYPAAQEKLAEAVQNADYPDVRVHAAFLLVQFKDVRAVPQLLEALSNKSQTIRLTKLFDLMKIEAVSNSQTFSLDANLPLRYVAAWALGYINTLQATFLYIEQEL